VNETPKSWLKSLPNDDTHSKLQPIRLRNASIFASGARDTATRLTSRWLKWTPIGLKLSAQKEQWRQPSSHSGPNMKW
jgi:hypothetical protein